MCLCNVMTMWATHVYSGIIGFILLLIRYFKLRISLKYLKKAHKLFIRESFIDDIFISNMQLCFLKFCFCQRLTHPNWLYLKSFMAIVFIIIIISCWTGRNLNFVVVMWKYFVQQILMIHLGHWQTRKVIMI